MQEQPELTELDEQKAQESNLERIERVQIFGSKIMAKANEAVSKRATLEQRWIEDLQQYEGRYDAAAEAAIKADPTKSGVFVNLTRRNTNDAESRVSDLLFPTDDKNFGIDPTPVPQLSSARHNAAANGEQEIIDTIDATLEKAKKAAKEMEREIDDQLTEADYSSKAREALHEAALYGTGILKGAVVIGKTRKAWKTITDESGKHASVLETVEEKVATVQHVSVWNYFPDPAATKMEDREYDLERHYMTKKQLSDLRRSPSFIKDEIKELLADGFGKNNSDNGSLSQMRVISGLEGTTFLNNRYEVWEYHGAVDHEDLEDLGVEIDEERGEYDCVVFVCNNRVIKAVLNPLDSSDHPYSVMNWQVDASSIFGKGIPRLMRDSQGVINAAWRTLMENTGVSATSQIVIDRKAISPENGKWEIVKGKVWLKKDQNVPINAAFQTFDIPSHQAELMNLIEVASKLSDEEISLPRLMYGESAGASAQTMGGMAMQMNATNVVLRRIIKNWDDHVTRPMIGRFYDWNMQFSDKEDIKGDYSVKARGSSALLIKEQQAQSLMTLLQIASTNPIAAELTEFPELYKHIIKSMHLDSTGIIKTDEAIKAAQEQAQQQQGQADPAMQIAQMKLQGEQQILQMRIQSEQQLEQMKAQEREQERQMKMQEAQVNYEVTMMKLSADQNIAIEKINADLIKVRETNDSKWKLFISEIEAKSIQGSGI